MAHICSSSCSGDWQDHSSLKVLEQPAQQNKIPLKENEGWGRRWAGSSSVGGLMVQGVEAIAAQV